MKFANQSLCSFTNSAMNIEFVSLILLGINNFLDNRIIHRRASESSGGVMGGGLKKEKSKIVITRTKDDTRITLCDL
jgi:hypothetical protein